MKRLLSLAVAAALLAALTLPAAAAETKDARLAQVTQAVKDTLGLDTGGYETFRGGLSEDLVPVWDLSWQGEARSLSVSALEDGTVASLYRWERDSSSASTWRDVFPTFPENAGAEDRALAEAFLSRVLREGETVELKDPEGGEALGASESAWSGTVLLNGLPSPLRYSIRVENGWVEQFSRDLPETTGVGGVPSPEASADMAKVREDLNGALELQLEYVRERAGSAKAVLRYLPAEGAHAFLADAKTGDLLDLTELEELLRQGARMPAGDSGAGAAPTAKNMAADEAGLTKVEQEGVQQMEGVLSKEELDKALRAESAYGLRGYALISSSYETVPGEEGREPRVQCTLRYARTDAGERLTRNITVDAKTGAVESVWSSAPYGREKAVSEEAALEKAQAFLKTWRPDWDLTLYQTDREVMPWRMESQPYWQFTFAQAVNGLPFRDNAVHVGIDGADGSVYSLSHSWDEDVTFDDANGLVSMETARTAWVGTYEAVTAYRNVPQKLVKADPAQAALISQGMEYAYALRLTVGLEREDRFEGVDAKTGKLVPEERGTTREPLAYKDLAGSTAKADIEKLAGYGVGYATETFRPGKTVTQWELVALLYSLQGPALNPDGGDRGERDNAYFNAYRMGALKASDRDDNAVLTRGEVVRMLLDAAGYGPAARLRGIYACAYSDKDAIPAEGLGYAAIAQGLGMTGDLYAGTRSATRGEAASMVCRLLERAI